jgi:hypothetical protein
LAYLRNYGDIAQNLLHMRLPSVYQDPEEMEIYIADNYPVIRRCRGRRAAIAVVKVPTIRLWLVRVKFSALLLGQRAALNTVFLSKLLILLVLKSNWSSYINDSLC